MPDFWLLSRKRMSVLASIKKWIWEIVSDNEIFYLRLKYLRNTGQWLHLNPPRNYTESLQWLKLYDRNPLYRSLVDKYEAKKIVASIIGEEYVVPLLGVWDDADSIDFGSLPEQFVIKCTHLSGKVYCCRNRAEFDENAVRESLRRDLTLDYYSAGHEWPYKSLKGRIIAEEYLSDGTSAAITDYKFFCFSGEPKMAYISKDASDNPTTDFFDMDYNHLPIRMRDPNSSILPKKPEQFELMKELARKLSSDFPHVRIDFYLSGGRVYFGEYTFYHCSGFSLVQPEEWNVKMGAMIDRTSVFSNTSSNSGL